MKCLECILNEIKIIFSENKTIFYCKSCKTKIISETNDGISAYYGAFKKQRKLDLLLERAEEGQTSMNFQMALALAEEFNDVEKINYCKKKIEELKTFENDLRYDRDLVRIENERIENERIKKFRSDQEKIKELGLLEKQRLLNKEEEEKNERLEHQIEKSRIAYVKQEKELERHNSETQKKVDEKNKKEKNTDTKLKWKIDGDDEFLEAIVDGNEFQWDIVFYEKVDEPEPETIPLSDVSSLFSNEIIYGLPKLGIHNLLPFQVESAQEIQKNENLMISAPTGSGKSESFLLPILNKLQNSQIKNQVQVLLIYPTIALADDQSQKIAKMLKVFGFDDIKLGKLHSGIDSRIRDSYNNTLFSAPPQIVVTTFDTLNNAMTMNSKKWKMMSTAKILVMDEAHSYSSSFGTHVHYVIKRLKQKIPEIQFIACSATLENTKDFFKKLINSDSSPHVIETKIGRKKTLHKIILAPKDNNFLTIMSNLTTKLCELENKTLVFSNSHDDAEIITKNVQKNRISIEVHKGNLTSEERQDIEIKMKGGTLDAISATSTLELGIDIGHVNAVITSFTNDLDNFQQRIGRAGRQGQKSYAISVLDEKNPICHYYAKNISEYLNQKHIVEINPENPIILKTNNDFMEVERKCMMPENYMHKWDLFQKLETQSIRGMEDSIPIYIDGKKSTSRNIPIAYHKLFKNAIFKHKTKIYRSTGLVKNNNPYAKLTPANFDDIHKFTSPIVRKSITEIIKISTKNFTDIKINYCHFKIDNTIIGYKEGIVGQDFKNSKKYDLIGDDKFSWSTENLGFRISSKFFNDCDDSTLHTICHLITNASKIITKCDDSDLESYVDGSDIIIYDNSSHGANGFSEMTFNDIPKIFQTALNTIDDCNCKNIEGCMKCTFTTSHCDTFNKDLSKNSAGNCLRLLQKNIT